MLEFLSVVKKCGRRNKIAEKWFKNVYFQVAMSLLYAHSYIFIVFSNNLVKYFIMRKYEKKFEFTNIVFAQNSVKILIFLLTFQVRGGIVK